MTSRGTLDLNFLTLRRLFPYRNGTTDISANTILRQTPTGEVEWIDPVDVFGDVSGTLVAKGNCESDYLYWDQSSKLWLAGGSHIHIGCGAGVVQPDASAVAVAIGQNAGHSNQGATSIAVGQYAGNTTQGLDAVAMGSYAGSVNQSAGGVAIGANAGVSTQGTGSIAIGASAGAVRQDLSAVAIGFNAGLNIQGAGSVAMGAYAGYMDQSGSAVAIGFNAGSNKQGRGAVAMGAGAGLACQTTNAVAVGYYAGSGNQGADAVAVGVNAGCDRQGISAIAMGSLAGSATQGKNAIAIGSNAGRDTQGIGAVAIGALAGSNVQLSGAIAIGSNAGFSSQNFNAVAMGIGAGYSSQRIGSIAIGSNAGYSTQNAGAVAIGIASGFSTQGEKAVAIGSNAGFGSQGVGAVAMGAGAGYSTQNPGAVAIGSNAGFSTQDAGAVAIGLSAGWSSQGANAVAVGLNAGVSTQGTGAVAIGSSAGATDQSANAVAIGLSAGFSTQGTSAVAIGWKAGSNVQGTGAIAVGDGAGLTRQGTNAVAIGLGAGYSTQNTNAIAIGSNAGYFTQGSNAIAFGQGAGISTQGINAIAIGSNAGANVQKMGAIAMGTRAGWSTQGAGAVAIGSNAGVMDQSANAVAIGLSAGWSTQGTSAIAIGSNAGYSSQGSYAVAIGAGAGAIDQSANAIAIGSNAGTNQGDGGIAIGAIPATHIQKSGAIAIGFNAFRTTQNANSIAIGNNVCGANAQGSNAIAIGYNATSATQPANSIILNATGVGLMNATQQTLYLDPVLNYSGNSDLTYLLQYRTGSKAVVYNDNVSINSATGRINVSGDILPIADITYSLGSSALAFKHLYVSSIITDTSNVAISGDIVPSADNVYSVGLSTQRWKDMFVGSGSIYIGGSTSSTRATLGSSGMDLLINSANTGNVGIGVIGGAPTAKLHVEGTTYLDETVTLGGDIVPSTTGTHDVGTALTRWRAVYTSTINSGNILPTTDNTFSLGLSTQRWKDVFVGPGSVYIGGSTISTRVSLESSGADLIINSGNTGNVGIGVTNPTARLDVSGTSNFRGTMTVSGDIVPFKADTYDLGSSAVRWDNIYTNFIDVSAGFTFTGNLNPSADNTYSLGINTTRWKDLYIGTGAVYIGGAIDASRAILESSGNSLIINKTNGGFVGIGTANPLTLTHLFKESPYASRSTNPLISASGAPQLTLGAGTARLYCGIYYTSGAGSGVAATIQSSDYYNSLDNGTALLLNPIGGFVGIGTANPYTTLDVSGGTRATTMSINADTDATQSGLYFNVANVAKFVIERPAGASDLRFLNNTTGAGAFAQMTLKSNGNVGIGTTDPGSYKLSIIGSLNLGEGGINAYQNIRLNGGNSYGYIYTQYDVITIGDGIHMGFNFYADSSGTKVIHNPVFGTSRLTCRFGEIGFYTGPANTEPSQKMVIDATGNVGIGTNNPGYKLDVNGNIRAQGAVYGEFNAVFDPQIIARGTGANINRFAYMGYNTVNNFGYIGAIESGIAQRDLHIQKDGGNVRIGSTTAPAYTLDVAGTINTNSAYYQSGYQLLPQGIILMWNGASTPTGWFICDGTNGTPDLRGRFVLASGQGTGLTNRTRGDVSGEETHTLTIPEMPAHSHTIGSSNTTGGGSGFDEVPPINTGSTGSTGGGLPHNNMPPFYVLVFIMKGF